MTTGEFIKLLSDDDSWTAGEDFGFDDILLRKNCARIIHRYLQKVIGEPDDITDLPTNADVPDLYDCRICAPHIIQVMAKGIMEPHKRGSLLLFEGDAEVTNEEISLFFEKISGSVR